MIAVGPDIVFYDGACVLCHRWVRFLLHRDREGTRFRFAPLGGETFGAEVPERVRPSLPDSVVVKTPEGRLLVRSEAALHLLRRLGGGWARLAGGLGLVPRAALDLLYDSVARARRRLFRRPEAACPVVATELRARFLP